MVDVLNNSEFRKEKEAFYKLYGLGSWWFASFSHKEAMEDIKRIAQTTRAEEKAKYRAIIKEARNNAYKAGRNDRFPEKCDKCGNNLNIWIGSHTCIRSQTLAHDENGNTVSKVTWICSSCYEKAIS